jgi:hypothetical protein
MNPTNTNPNDNAVLGQKYAFATAALISGIACYVNLLGLEKAALAIIFAVLALRPNPRPSLREQPWAGQNRTYSRNPSVDHDPCLPGMEMGPRPHSPEALAGSEIQRRPLMCSPSLDLLTNST